MPIYEYYCTECGHEFEVMQKITDKPIRKCEKCGRLKAKKMVSRTSFVLKGSGWYVTDYGGKKSDSISNPPPKKDNETSTADKGSSPSKSKESDVGETKKAVGA